MSKKPAVLMILDGFGLNEKHEANAVYEANTPNIDGLMKDYPFVRGNASGLAVGLPDGQMGNSEVGHLNMGAGRIVYQELTRISKEIEDGDFFKNEALLKGMQNVKEHNSSLHLYGLLTAAYTATTPICMGCWSWQSGKALRRFTYTASWMGATPPPLPGRALWKIWKGK